MARLMALCSLPRTNPGNRQRVQARNGPFKLYMVAGAENKLPFGNIPRLLAGLGLTEAVRTQSRELVLGKPRFTSSCERSAWKIDSGSARGDRTRLRNQMKRLFQRSVIR